MYYITTHFVITQELSLMSNISLETMVPDKREGFLKWYATNASTMLKWLITVDKL